jgi:WD40 repeat protein
MKKLLLLTPRNCRSEENEHFLISGSGDGSIKLWDIRAANQPPIRSFEEHNHEVYAVDWNLQVRNCYTRHNNPRTANYAY